MALRIGLGLGLSGGVSFSPLSLFAASEPGFWFDPSDISTLFQDSAGTTPVTAAGQSVGLVLDKSGRGNHATQSTSLSRPTLGRNPASGTRNLLTFTQEFDNAAWTKTAATVTANAATAPDGTLTADTVIETAAASAHHVSRTYTSTAGTAYSLSVSAKMAGRRYLTLSTGDGSAALATFDLLNGSISGAAAVIGANWSTPAAQIVSLGNGWYRCSVTGIDVVGGSRTAHYALNSTGSNPAAGSGTSYTGDGTSGVYLWGAQLEAGSTATAYQRVTSTYDVTEAGKADCWYLGFDGSDDFLVTPTITPGTDKVQVFAGVRKLSDAALGVVAETGAGVTQSIKLFAPRSAAPNYAFTSTGTLPGEATGTGFAAPITNVLTGIGDIANDVATLRANGTQAATSAADQGTGNYGNYPAYIGRRGGTSLPFNGRIYSLICRFGSDLTADQIAQTESWVNSKTGAY